MSLRINNNIASINGHRNMLKNDMAISKSLEKLSSGLRINRAADDAAGLVISEQMRAQITGLNQAIDNSETAIAMVQTAEGALDEVNSLLNKARELVLHAANDGANDLNQLQADQAELDNVIRSITRIGDFTQFGTKKLLDGSLNGAKDLTASAGNLLRVNVGNLANNSAVSAGAVSIAVTGGAKEAQTLMGGTDEADAYVFNTTDVTGSAITSGASINSGTVVSLTIDGDTYSVTGQIGGTTAADLISGLNTQLTAAGGDFTVGLGTGGGGLKVSRTDYGDNDFTTSVTFSRAATPDSTGTVASSAAFVANTVGNETQALAQIFEGSAADFSNITESGTTVDAGSIFTATVSTNTGGYFTATISGGVGGEFVDGDDLDTVLTALQTEVRTAMGTGYSGVTVQLDSAAGSGFSVSLAQADDSIATNFTFALEVDFNNAPAAAAEVQSINLNGSSFSSGGANPLNATFIVPADASSGIVNLAGASGAAVLLNTGAAISVNIDGNTYVVSGGAGQTLTAIAAELQSAFSGFVVTYQSGGAAYTGYVGATTGATFSGSFVFERASGEDFSLSLSVDQIDGLDDNFAGAAVQAGVEQQVSMNLDTFSSSNVSGIATESGHAAVTITNATGSTVAVNGGSPTATMTSSNGVSVSLTASGTSAEGIVTMALSSASGNAGFSAISFEIDDTLANAGGTASFTLSNGADFQVGANVTQKVGVTLTAINALELGRNVEDSGVLSSLAELHSEESGALLNGLTDEALRVIDKAIDEVTNARGKLGAFQANTLETGLNSLRVSQENLTAAESTIRDVDFAAESARFTRNNIMIQASTAMLAQANQLPQNVLQLLG